MIAAPLRFVYGFIAGLGVAAVLAGIIVALINVTSARQRDREQVWIATSMRGLVQGIITWRQVNGDPRAEPDTDWASVLWKGGYIASEMLNHPNPRYEGVPPYIYVRLARERPWANSFTAIVPVLIQNPATTDGRGGLVAYTDNHLDFIPEPAFSRLVAGLLEGGRAVGPFPNNTP